MFRNFLKIKALGVLLAQAPHKTLLNYLASDSLSVDTTTFGQIAQLVSSAEMMAHIYFLASDPLQGREAGTTSEKVAAAYLIAQHRRFGNKPLLRNTYLHTFPLRRERVLPQQNRKRSNKLRLSVIYDTLQAWNVLAMREGSKYPNE
ncbi:MAG: hypothetical protein RMJ66_05685, partial [Bacteroidia bacterium]|nr:hypothetical protein [Bacteroidia bacterium]MDW8134540.1 hypothetical protein [Bacteroidia bacterium]